MSASPGLGLGPSLGLSRSLGLGRGRGRGLSLGLLSGLAFVPTQAEKSKQAERQAERQFALRREHHALAAGQLELRRVSEAAAAVGDYQHQRIRLMVGTTLC